MSNPYETPEAEVHGVGPKNGEYRYVGFWKRVLGAIIDTIVLMIVMMPLIFLLLGGYAESTASVMSLEPLALIINYLLPAAIYVFLWHKFGVTPSKKLFNAKIIDAETGGPISLGQSVTRYLGYLLGSLVLCLGLIWVGFSKTKQGWHDKMAGTLVVYND